MKGVCFVLIFILFYSFIACNKEKEVVLDNEWLVFSIRLENGDFTTPTSQYYFIPENRNSFKLLLDINTCSGKVNFRSKTVAFSDGITCTEACCDSDFAIALINNLVKTKYWEINGQKLVLSNDKGLEIVFNKR